MIRSSLQRYVTTCTLRGASGEYQRRNAALLESRRTRLRVIEASIFISDAVLRGTTQHTNRHNASRNAYLYAMLYHQGREGREGQLHRFSKANVI